MFRRNKKSGSEDKCITKGEKQNPNTIVFKREIHHIKSIVDGKLYDTEKAVPLSCLKDGRVLFRTSKGNYFSCKAKIESYEIGDNCTIYKFYHDIRPEDIADAKEAVGKYNVERYIELFGKPEEA